MTLQLVHYLGTIFEMIVDGFKKCFRTQREGLSMDSLWEHYNRGKMVVFLENRRYGSNNNTENNVVEIAGIHSPFQLNKDDFVGAAKRIALLYKWGEGKWDSILISVTQANIIG